MAINLELTLPPGYTTTVQLYARTGGAAVGSPVAGVPDGGDPTLYVFALGTPAIGDYDVQLSGLSEPDGLPFPMRVTSTTVYYLADTWAILDATVMGGIVIPASVDTALCNVLFAVKKNATPVVGATVQVFLEQKNNTIDSVIISRATTSGVTDSDGMVTLTLLRFAAFTTGGVYRVRIYESNGHKIHDRAVKVPNSGSANAEDLEEVT